LGDAGQGGMISAWGGGGNWQGWAAQRLRGGSLGLCQFEDTLSSQHDTSQSGQVVGLGVGLA
jgi:hypothetical protein